MDLDKDTLLKMVKPLYVVPEAGNHWFNTYHKLHTENLKMSSSMYKIAYYINTTLKTFLTQ